MLEKTAIETKATIVSAGDGDNIPTKTTAAQKADTAYLQFVTGEQADALMLASLLGAWNEKVEGDREAIEELVEGHD
jgi:hypothetical protein